MRVIGQISVILCISATLTAQAPEDRAAKVLAETRAALGGDTKLSAVRSFTTTGRTKRVQGENLVPIEFEIAVEMPDKYLRKDEIPAQESDPTTTGFNGQALLQVPPPAPPEPRPGMPPPLPGQFENMLKQRALTARQDFARLMLGMFASSFTAYPLTFTYIGQAEAPQGKAHVLEATGENNFKIRFFVHEETSLPIMVSWSLPMPVPVPARPAARGRGEVTPSPAGPQSPSVPPSPAAPAPSSPPENRLYFADYRDVDGLKWPFRLRRAIGVNTTEETTFDRFRINPKIDPRRFEVRTGTLESKR